MMDIINNTYYCNIVDKTVKVHITVMMIPFPKLSRIRNNPFYRRVDLWNSFRVEHHRAENKKKLKQIIKDRMN